MTLSLGPSATGDGADGSALNKWEPGSARVPTFCAEFDPLLPPGRASGEGDLLLPALDGEGGGDPKRESFSSSLS